jgi:transposase
VSYEEIKGIFAQVNSSKKNCWESVKRMSIDEISMRKSQGNLVSVVSDSEGGNLIEMINSHRL